MGSVEGDTDLTEEAGPSYEHFDSDGDEESSPVKVEAEDVGVELTEEEDAEVTDNLDLNAVEGNSRDDREWVAERQDEDQSHSSSEQEEGKSVTDLHHLHGIIWLLEIEILEKFHVMTL